MSKQFHQIIVQEKTASGSNDWRGYCRCTDSKGNKWELRGTAANTPGEAAQNAYNYFLDDEVHWDIYGERKS